jgi:hypothetical protein
VSGSFQAGWPAGQSKDGFAHMAVARLATPSAPDLPPLTNIAVVHLPNGESLPPGYKIAQAWDPISKSWTPCPLSGRSPPHRSLAPHLQETFLCFSRKEGAPILDIGVALPLGGSTDDLHRAASKALTAAAPPKHHRASAPPTPAAEGGGDGPHVRVRSAALVRSRKSSFSFIHAARTQAQSVAPPPLQGPGGGGGLSHPLPVMGPNAPTSTTLQHHTGPRVAKAARGRAESVNRALDTLGAFAGGLASVSAEESNLLS